MASKFDAEALDLHKSHHGKLAVTPTVPLTSRDDLSRAYTPGVAAPCLAIKADPESIYDYTTKGNMVAVVTNGTAVLGLGNIGAGAGLPVMEGKSILFKGFAGVDSIPVCVNSPKVEDVVKVCQLIAPTYGGINLEDIKAPQCFDIENELKKTLDIPVFHDDQHGTAIVVVSALLNAYKYLRRDLRTARIVINGAGAAGQAIARLLFAYGATTVVLCDTTGAIYEGRPENMNPYKESIAKVSNLQKERGSLAEVVKGKDIFIGVSAPGSLTQEMIKTMSPEPVVMRWQTPSPRSCPTRQRKRARASSARVVPTSRTRSTTSSHSPASSAAPLTSVPRRSTRR